MQIGGHWWRPYLITAKSRFKIFMLMGEPAGHGCWGSCYHVLAPTEYWATNIASTTFATSSLASPRSPAIVKTANAALITLYWNVENRIETDILGNERAQYGRQIVHALSAELTAEYGKGFFREKPAADGPVCRGVP